MSPAAERVAPRVSSPGAGRRRAASSQSCDPRRPCPGSLIGHSDVGLAGAPASPVACEQLVGLRAWWSAPRGPVGSLCPDRLGHRAPVCGACRMFCQHGHVGNAACPDLCGGRPVKAGRATQQRSPWPSESPSACQTFDSGPSYSPADQPSGTHSMLWSVQSPERTSGHAASCHSQAGDPKLGLSLKLQQEDHKFSVPTSASTARATHWDGAGTGPGWGGSATG